MLEALTLLPIPCPPNIERAIGYQGTSRHVAFYWTSMGDEAMWDDGRSSADGSWQAYLFFIRHPKVEPGLTGNFGNSDQEATHWLLLDRQERQFYAGTAKEVQHVLFHQYPHQLPRTETEVQAVLEAVKTSLRGHLSGEMPIRVMNLIQHEAEQLAMLYYWLDSAPSPQKNAPV